MSLDFETPAKMFAERMPEKGVVTDKQTGEKYAVEKGDNGVAVRDV